MPSTPSGPCSSSDRLSKCPHVWNCQELLVDETFCLSQLDHVQSTMPIIETESECLHALLLFFKRKTVGWVLTSSTNQQHCGSWSVGGLLITLIPYLHTHQPALGPAHCILQVHLICIMPTAYCIVYIARKHNVMHKVVSY